MILSTGGFETATYCITLLYSTGYMWSIPPAADVACAATVTLSGTM
jgi:hypothetical protein